MFGTWWNALIHPSKTMAEEKNNASYGKAILNFLLPFTIFFFLAVLALSTILSSFSGSVSFGTGGLVAVVIVFLVMAFILILANVISNIFTLFSAKLFGGIGDFKTQFYLVSLASAAGFVELILLGILGIVIFLLFMALKLAFLMSLLFMIVLGGLWYAFYLSLVSLQETHSVSVLRALGIYILAWVVFTILLQTLASSLFPALPWTAPIGLE